MRTLLLLSTCLLSACASTGPQSPPAVPDFAGTPVADSIAASDGTRERGRRGALWTGIGFALYAIYEANNDDYLSPAPALTCLSLKCW